MKILITNIVTLNVGDAAILHAMIRVLRAAFGADTQFVVYDKDGSLPGRYYPELEFRPLLYLTRELTLGSRGHGLGLNGLFRRLDPIRFGLGRWATKRNLFVLQKLILNEIERRDLLEYQTADLIVSSGGTYLVENYSLTARIFDYQLSLYLDRPLVFFTQSLGPFSDPENRRVLRPIFDNSLAILLRDERSKQHLQELGVNNTNIAVAADAAFALSDPELLETAKRRVGRVGERLRVAISVREWRHFKTIEPSQGMNNYYDSLRALTEHLVAKHNAEITYISTCQGMPEYWTDDSKVAEGIVGELCAQARSSVSIDDNFHSPAALMEKLKTYDLVIATRMHMAILALSVGTPVLPIAYEFKMRELFKGLGQERWVQDIETISRETLTTATDQLLAELPELREPIFTAVQKEYENAVASGELVKKAFEERRQPTHR